MKKVVLFLFTISLISACGGKSQSGRKLGEEVCDCSEKANAMDAADPKRPGAQADCVKKQSEAWDKIKDDQKEADEFNKVLHERLSAQIKKATGK
jgi:hypothetical protein